VHLATKLADLLALISHKQIGTLPAVRLSLAHTLSQRLVVNTQVSSYLRDRPPGLEHEPDAARHQLIGVLPRSWHEREVPLSRDESLV